MRREPLKYCFFLLLALAAVNFMMLLSGYRILVDEQRGEEYTEFVRFVGSRKIGDTLTCTYWTGRSVRKVHFGAYQTKPDECPFFYSPF